MIGTAVVGGCGSAGSRVEWRVESTAPAAAPAVLGSALANMPALGTYLDASDRDRRLEVEKVAGDGGETRLVRTLREGTSAPRVAREQLLRAMPEGSVELSREINHREGVVVIFEPPLVVLPREVEPDRPWTQKVHMRVHPIGNLKRTRAQGEVLNTISVEAQERLVTPAGIFDAVKIVSVFEADLGATTVRNQTEQWFASDPRVGIVVERRHEKTTLVGVAIRDSTETWVLRDAPEAPRERGP
jgi:hypothetical protein